MLDRVFEPCGISISRLEHLSLLLLVLLLALHIVHLAPRLLGFELEPVFSLEAIRLGLVLRVGLGCLGAVIELLGGVFRRLLIEQSRPDQRVIGINPQLLQEVSQLVLAPLYFLVGLVNRLLALEHLGFHGLDGRLSFLKLSEGLRVFALLLLGIRRLFFLRLLVGLVLFLLGLLFVLFLLLLGLAFFLLLGLLGRCLLLVTLHEPGELLLVLGIHLDGLRLIGLGRRGASRLFVSHVRAPGFCL